MIDQTLNAIVNGGVQGGTSLLVLYCGFKFILPKLDKIESDIAEVKGIVSIKCKKEKS